MNNKAFTISLVLAGLAVFMIYSYITSKEEEIKARHGTETAVVVAKTDIGEMLEIHDNMIEIVSKPKRYVDPGWATSKQEVVGFIAALPIRKGEQITVNKLMAPGIKSGLSKQVTPGKRAISIPVDDFNAVNRLIKPGDRIDVVATIDPPGAAKGQQLTKLVLQDVPVLAVGEFVTSTAPRKVDKDETTGAEVVRNLNLDRNFNSITVELEPISAAQLTLLKDTQTRLSVLLRNNDDTERVNMGATTLYDVMGSDVNKIRGVAGQK